jgi:tetratricopeptide (TPR) repeat protein
MIQPTNTMKSHLKLLPHQSPVPFLTDGGLETTLPHISFYGAAFATKQQSTSIMKPHPEPNRRLSGILLATISAALISSPGTALCKEAPPAESNTGSHPLEKKIPLFEGMGPHTRKITTASAEAQRYFDQALNWTFAFNHDEAIRSFEQAAMLDPACAMAWWGKALCHGPHINNPAMDEAGAIAAWSALQKALRLSGTCTPAERALIEALAPRYADPAAGKLPLTADERRPFDEAFAHAMAKVHSAYPDDADITSLYAESLMDLHPWDLYDNQTNEPHPWTEKIVSLIEHALRLDPKHPGANHLYIHAVEGSSTPGRANVAADVLRTLVPASGHLVHMPSHIDVRVGRWAQAAEQNRQASKVDVAYRKISPDHGIYHLYMAHDDHFLAWSCMMLGRREEALTAARDMIRKIPADFSQAAAPFVDPLASIEISVLMRFGRWDELLALPRPDSHLPVTTAMWHFARGSALAALDRVDEALAEQSEFRKAVAALPEGIMLQQSTAADGLAVADGILDGEIAFRRGNIDAAVAALRKAVAKEDLLRYIEPPDWLQPARHSLGAILVAADRLPEAEDVYRADLERWPENGWALYGLAECVKARKSPEADEIQARFEKAWQHADTQLAATCLCVKTAETRDMGD